ncbi:MAG: hypothetical protein L0229_10870 [Blastocatellia bacterium]|nr:hypothetical protein [Blastocatellia bacterium]
MKKIGVMFAMILLLAGVSVSAQDFASDQVFDREYDINVQDEATGNYLVFNSQSGYYKFVRCSDGAVMSGRGQVTRKGCTVDLVDIGPLIAGNRGDIPLYKVLVSADECTKQAKGAVEINDWMKGKPPIPPMKETLSDSDISNNTTGCSNSSRDF